MRPQNQSSSEGKGLTLDSMLDQKNQQPSLIKVHQQMRSLLYLSRVLYTHLQSTQVCNIIVSSLDSTYCEKIVWFGTFYWYISCCVTLGHYNVLLYFAHAHGMCCQVVTADKIHLEIMWLWSSTMDHTRTKQASSHKLPKPFLSQEDWDWGQE